MLYSLWRVRRLSRIQQKNNRMSDNQSVEFFLRFLREKHQLFISSINELFANLVDENKDSKKLAAENSKEAAIVLKNNLSDQDVPGWLQQSIKSLEWYLRNLNTSGANNNLLKRLIGIQSEMNNHQWKFELSNDTLAFDFDSIYEKCKNESKIDELFESIITLLQKIISSGEIDSIKTMSVLEKLIATLKKHEKASYFSINSMYDFLLHLMKNVLWAQLESLPVIGPITKGLKKTIEETGIELEGLTAKMKSEMIIRYETEFKLLENGFNKQLNK